MTDRFGVPLSIGDKVIYTTGAQGCTYLETGTILDITSSTSAFGTSMVAKIKSDESGRTLSNGRGMYGLVSITPIKIQHPELFI